MPPRASDPGSLIGKWLFLALPLLTGGRQGEPFGCGDRPRSRGAAVDIGRRAGGLLRAGGLGEESRTWGGGQARGRRAR